ncbi:MAG: hypothetical protein KAJ34_05560 [Thermodesulfovibrionia bacterium]|nr:hypothetical protein [Thermodesulfovibrionia bacterium]MCK5427142.1 hypothetical protein [Thermodesulfovibrionia bacterium]
MTLRKLSVFLGILFLCVGVIYIIYPNDEKRIIKIIRKSQEAVLSEDSDKLMGFISYNYRDNYNNGYIQIKEITSNVFRRLSDIEIEKNIVKISTAENTAEAVLSVRVIASDSEERGYIIGNAARAETIKLFFEKSPHTWMITSVEGVFEKPAMVYE